MSVLTREVDAIQNPAVGSLLVWRFACHYRASHRESAAAPFFGAFFVLPLILTEEYCSVIRSTQMESGLRLFIDKFAQPKLNQADSLLRIHSLVGAHRRLTLESLQLAVHANLVAIESRVGPPSIVPQTTTMPSGVEDHIQQLARQAEKFGAWCADLTLFELTQLLKTVL